MGRERSLPPIRVAGAYLARLSEPVAIHALLAAALFLMLATPALWVLGVDQLSWLCIGFLVGGLALHGRTPLPWPLRLAGAFLLVILVSGILGAVGYRWITLARELAIAGVFFATMAGVASTVSRRDPILPLMVGVVFVVAVSSVSSLLAFVLQDSFSFNTPIASVVPDGIGSTRLGALSFTDRSLGTPSYLIGHIFLRPHGLFLFSTSQAVALAVATPLLLGASVSYPSWRWVFRVAAMLAAMTLLTTTTRMAIIGLLLAFGALWAVRRWEFRRGIERRPNRRAVFALLTVLAGALVVSHATGLTRPVGEIFLTRSIDFRGALYQATFERWRERPLLGWGTEVDWTLTPRATGASDEASADLPPLGSHSHYLGVLFKQGLVGAGLFGALIVVLLLCGRRVFLRAPPGGHLILVAFGASLVAAVTEALWLDPATAFIVAVSWGIVAGAGGSAPTRSSSHAHPVMA